MRHKTTRTAKSAGPLADPVVRIEPVKEGRDTVPTHWRLEWQEELAGGSRSNCSRTGDSRADLRKFAKEKLKATHFYDGTGDRAIRL